MTHVEHNYHRNMMKPNSNSILISHIHWNTKRVSIPEQEAHGVYYAITKWNYCLQEANIIVCNNYKPLAKFLNGKNGNNKGQQMGTGTCNLQYHIWLDIRSTKKAARQLPLQIGQTTKQ